MGRVGTIPLNWRVPYGFSTNERRLSTAPRHTNGRGERPQSERGLAGLIFTSDAASDTLRLAFQIPLVSCCYPELIPDPENHQLPVLTRSPNTLVASRGATRACGARIFAPDPPPPPTPFRDAFLPHFGRPPLRRGGSGGFGGVPTPLGGKLHSRRLKE